MNIDLIELTNTVTKDDIRHIMAHNPLEPLAITTINQMVASGEIKQPKRRGRFLVWTKKYIAEINDMSVESLNDILRVVERIKKAS